ncbi:hypothetical protein FOL47_007914 [Perkinsus chesapeaki]|uniref:Protease Do-like PDZ domain-containing protein n=1 Tax=Perkinsus chesapeaki TaxID=330153 RepID=A0A7J6LHB0_PERCH|nr:hypothetical protein FOL47_007914 [Perkinsus chesapeaki]
MPPDSVDESWRKRNLILTAAHVVADSIYLTVQRNTDYFEPNKYPAIVRAVCHDSDLALVEIDDVEGSEEEFRNGDSPPDASSSSSSHHHPIHKMEPLELAKWDVLPELRDTVQVVGYPVGGDKLSVTSGVVSRCEVVEYSHSARPALGITVDAAINAGNSGGPVMCPNSDKVLGVAFQKYVSRGVENQGHAVPSYLIWRFIRRLTGSSSMTTNTEKSLDLPSLGVTCQPVENEQFREWLGMKGKDSKSAAVHKGVMVSWSINPALKKYDVITAINDTPLDNFGHVWFLGRRLYMTALLDSFYIGDTVNLTVLSRGNGDMSILEHRKVKLLSQKDCLLVQKGQSYDVKAPPYMVSGGLVFQPLSMDYLRGWSSDRDRPTHLQHILNTARKKREGAAAEGGEGGLEECIVLTQVLADECNSGYGSGWVGGPIVEKVNNHNICCLAHLEEVFDSEVYGEDKQRKYVVLELFTFCHTRTGAAVAYVKVVCKEVALLTMTTGSRRHKRSKHRKKSWSKRKLREDEEEGEPMSKGFGEIVTAGVERWETFYRKCGLKMNKGDEEWMDLINHLRAPLPISFRVRKDTSRPPRSIFDDVTLERNGRWIPGAKEFKWCHGYQLGCDPKTAKEAYPELNEWLKTNHGGIEGIARRQEVASMVPVAVLGIEPAHEVLDTSAAPGSKTLQALDVIDGGRGVVVANELSKCLVEYYDRVRRFYVPKSTMVDLRNGQTVTEVIRVTGGITNSLFKVKFVNKTDEVSPSTSAPADSTAGSSKGDYDGEVSTPREGLPICLVRVFGEAGSSIIDRDNENKVFNDLSSIGFGPALLGIFRNGRIEEFFSHLRPLEPLEMVTEKWIPSIAKHLRYMHSLSPKSAAEIADGGKSIDLWKRISSYVEKGRELVRASPGDEETDFTEMLDSIEKQAHWLEGTIRTREKGIGSPLDKVVFCHNDLLSGNILVSKEHPSSQLKFIDYEYCAFNPAAADIANHFAAVVESMLIVNDDYNIDKYFPSRELQLLFLRNYLTVDEYARCDDNSMLETIRLYAMAAELRWCAWSVIQHFEQDRKQQQQTAADDDDEDIDDDPLFDYENYGRARLGDFHQIALSTLPYLQTSNKIFASPLHLAVPQELSHDNIESREQQYTLMTARQPGEGIIPDEVELVSDDVSPLTREQIVAGLGQVGLTPLHAGSHAFLSCTISDLALTNLDPALRKYCNLQVIDVSHNKLRRLDALSEMPFLRVIDASHNLLRRPDCFSFPKFLEKVDMSYNDIRNKRLLRLHCVNLEELGDWSNCRGHLRTLNLRGNSIKCIPPHSLQRTTLLDILDLSENQITTAENLSGLRELTTLRLADNQLISAPNLNGLTTLRELDLAGNFMKSLEGFKDSICPRMIKLDLSRNQIEDLPAVVEVLGSRQISPQQL